MWPLRAERVVPPRERTREPELRSPPRWGPREPLAQTECCRRDGRYSSRSPKDRWSCRGNRAARVTCNRGWPRTQESFLGSTGAGVRRRTIRSPPEGIPPPARIDTCAAQVPRDAPMMPSPRPSRCVLDPGPNPARLHPDPDGRECAHSGRRAEIQAGSTSSSLRRAEFSASWRADWIRKPRSKDSS